MCVYVCRKNGKEGGKKGRELKLARSVLRHETIFKQDLIRKLLNFMFDLSIFSTGNNYISSFSFPLVRNATILFE